MVSLLLGSYNGGNNHERSLQGPSEGPTIALVVVVQFWPPDGGTILATECCIIGGGTNMGDVEG